MVRINPVNKIVKSQFIIVKKLIESRGRGTSEEKREGSQSPDLRHVILVDKIAKIMNSGVHG